MSSTQSLPAAVEALEEKAKQHKQAENTQFHVSVARHNIRRVNSELDDLLQSLEDLQYYETVLEEAFDESAPTMTSSAVQAAESAVETTQEGLLEKAQSGEVSEGSVHDTDAEGNPEVGLTPAVEQQIQQIKSAQRQARNVIDQIEATLQSRREGWSKKVTAAEELQKILGGQNEDFSRTLNHMHHLLTRDMMDSSGSAADFVSKWSNSVDNWEQHQDLQSFDDFQETHDLSSSTIEDVRTLSESRQLTLADVSLDTLEEMKDVDELESAIDLSL